MSNFIVSNKNISTITKLIAKELRIYNNNDNKFYLNNDTINNALANFRNEGNFKINLNCPETIEKNIFECLENINNDAVNNRYNANNETIHQNPISWVFINSYNTQAYKYLQCFLYNSDNDETQEKYKGIFEFLEKLKNSFANYLVQSTEAYKNAE